MRKTYTFRVLETRTVMCEYGVEADTLDEARDLAEIGSTTWEYVNGPTMEVIDRQVGQCIEVEP